MRNVGISPRLIINAAQMYVDLNRALMEYLDNIFDAAENYYDKSKNEYTREIRAKIQFTGRSHEHFGVRFEDNCDGIEDLESIIQSIGNSSKRNNPDTNGTFAFGMLSFICMCERMIVSTKTLSSITAQSLTLKRDTFNQDKLEDTNVDFETDVPVETKMYYSEGNPNSWTVIELLDFDKDKYMQIDIDEFISEAEKHFELLLSRGNLKIDVTYPNFKIHRCKPFNYTGYDGETYSKKLTKLEYIACKKTSRKEIIDISKTPVTIFLRVINGKALDMRPVFVIKGRRVCEIADVKAFRTLSKTLVWSNYNLPGYVDATGILEPILSRNEFKNTKLAKALFSTLLLVEEEIKEFVDKNLKISMRGKYKLLESILKNALHEVAKEMSMLKQKEEIKDDLNGSTSEAGDFFRDYEIADSNPERNFKLEDNTAGRLQTGANTKNKRSYKRFKKISCPVEAQPDLTIPTALNTQEPNLNPIIEFAREPDRGPDNKLLRSKISGNSIIIFAKHPEFDSRVDKARDGIPKISQSIIHYISCELIKNFKVIELYRKDIEEDTSLVLNDYLSSLYLFEKKLQFLEGKKLSELK